MVSKEELESRFYLRDNKVFFLNGPKKNKQAGCLLPTGYRMITFKIGNRKHKLMEHKIIFGIHYGYIPDVIDHIDRDKTNNNIGNLREANMVINSINRGLQSNNTSGYKGVTRSKNKWMAQIKVYGKRIGLGHYENIQDAVKARKEAEIKYWYDIIGDEVFI